MTIAIKTHRAAAICTTLSLAPSLVALCTGVPAFARARHAAPASAGHERGVVADIVVTAQFRGEKPQDIPIAITSVNAATLGSRSRAKLTDVANEAPSLPCSRPRRLSSPLALASIRGMGRINASQEPSVSFTSTMFIICDRWGPISICSMRAGRKLAPAAGNVVGDREPSGSPV